MNKRNRKQWTLTLTDELETKINNYKQLYRLNENKEVLSHLLDNVLNLKPNTLNLINKICEEYKTTKDDVLTPIIERHINKTLKKDGVVKEKNKHTEKSESELLQVLIDMVDNYKKLPIEERKFISPTSVYKYLMVNKNKYKQKNYSVIKRVMAGLSDVDISFINEYHKENNLDLPQEYIDLFAKHLVDGETLKPSLPLTFGNICEEHD